MASHVGAFLAGALATTAIVAQAVPGPSSNADRYAALDTFARSLSYISNNYVDPVDERKLIHGAVQGMVARLDGHSAFLPPDRYKRLRQDTEGEFASVGITLTHGPDQDGRPDYPVIDAVLRGSPADRAGIRVGDQLLAIDGKPTAGPGITARPRALDSRLRGLSGTRVELVLERPAWPEPRTFALVRRRVKMPTVEWLSVEPGIGYVKVSRFQEATAADVGQALRALDKQGLRALILDLRGNPGGLLDQAVRVADLFLDRGVIVTIRGRRGTEAEREVARAAGTLTEVRVLVLIDQATASAAEIVAGALQDHGRATVLGLQSYGKGSVQTFVDLDDGSGLKLTTARYYTPRGTSLEATGITPDIHVEAFAEEVVVAGSAGAPDGSPDALDDPEEDSGTSVRPTKNATIRDRLVDDHQFEVAYQTVQKWLGSKESMNR
jgi:carboxyl-terminal processing protease